MIKFTNTFPQYIHWGNQIGGFAQRSMLWWAYFISLPAGGHLHGPVWISDPGDADDEVSYAYTDHTTGFLYWVFGWTGSNPAWRTNSAFNTAGRWYRFGITYDNGSVSNDPIFYVDGVSQASTELGAPSGSPKLGTTSQQFGSGGWGGPTIDGYWDGLCTYDVILTPEEMARDYAMRRNVVIERGLRFAAILNGSKGRQTFNGVTFDSNDRFLDPISRLEGIPKNSNSFYPTGGSYPIGFGSEIMRGVRV